MELSSHKSFKQSDRSLVAKALSVHFGPTTVFGMGNPSHMVQASADMALGVEQHLTRFESAGIGYNIFLEKSRIDVLSATSAACFLTWKIRPAPGAKVEAWSWENLYMYRRGGVFDPKDEQHEVSFAGDGWTVPEGRWEAVFSDNETIELLARLPNFFNGME